MRGHLKAVYSYRGVSIFLVLMEPESTNFVHDLVFYMQRSDQAWSVYLISDPRSIMVTISTKLK